MAARRTRPTQWLGLLIAAPLAGCFFDGRQMDLLESRLRQQEDAVYTLQSELETRDAELAAARREAELLRTTSLQVGGQQIAIEQAGEFSRAAGLRFNGLMTRPVDRDGEPGDDRLNVVLMPHDHQDELVKLPGAIELELIDLSQPEGSRTVAAWQFDSEQSQRHWHRGWISSGYQFDLPWQSPPTPRELILHARLTAPDGRQFEASQPLDVQPSTGAQFASGDAPERRVPGILRSSEEIQQTDRPPRLLIPGDESAGPPLAPPDDPSDVPVTIVLPAFDAGNQKSALVDRVESHAEASPPDEQLEQIFPLAASSSFEPRPHDDGFAPESGPIAVPPFDDNPFTAQALPPHSGALDPRPHSPLPAAAPAATTGPLPFPDGAESSWAPAAQTARFDERDSPARPFHPASEPVADDLRRAHFSPAPEAVPQLDPPRLFLPALDRSDRKPAAVPAATLPRQPVEPLPPGTRVQRNFYSSRRASSVGDLVRQISEGMAPRPDPAFQRADTPNVTRPE